MRVLLMNEYDRASIFFVWSAIKVYSFSVLGLWNFYEIIL